MFNASEVYTQTYGDKVFYLVDSLNMQELSIGDKQIIESCLERYHQSETDSSRITALEVIYNEHVSSSWEDYQVFQIQGINNALEDESLSLKKKVK